RARSLRTNLSGAGRARSPPGRGGPDHQAPLDRAAGKLRRPLLHAARSDLHAEAAPEKPHPPIWIGGTGEQMMLKLVARRADGWNTNGYISAEEYRQKAEVLARHCEAIGRDPTEIRRSVAWVVICAETDARAGELANHLQASIDRPLD